MRFRLRKSAYAVIDLKNCVIRLKDGGSQFIDVKVGTGNLSYDEKRNMEYILDRGLLDTVREGDQIPIDVRLDAQWEFLLGESPDPPTIEDVLKKRGQAASWVSTSTDTCEPFAVDIEINNDPPCTAGDPEKILLPDFRYESLNHDARAGTIAITGKCNAVQAIVTRPTAT